MEEIIMPHSNTISLVIILALTAGIVAGLTMNGGAFLAVICTAVLSLAILAKPGTDLPSGGISSEYMQAGLV